MGLRIILSRLKSRIAFTRILTKGIHSFTTCNTHSSRPVNLEDMPHFEDADNYVEVIQTIEYLDRWRRFKRRQEPASSIQTIFDTRAYTLDLILSKSIITTLPKTNTPRPSQIEAYEYVRLERFLAHVKHLKLNVIVDPNCLSNAEKVRQIEQELCQFQSLKNIKATIYVRSIAQVMRDESFQEISRFLWTYCDRRRCDVKIDCKRSDDSCIEATFMASEANRVFTDSGAALTLGKYASPTYFPRS